MTLQQKMLAKQSKKGFTLVELVVVIAILAILAAIAIPAVVGIINNANESQAKADASTADNACKSFYAAVVAGSLNSSSADAGKITGTNVLPAANANASTRKQKAQDATVKSALEWDGTYSQLSTKLGDFSYDKDGNIYAANDAARSSAGQPTLSETLKLGGTNGSTGLGYK